MTAGLSVSGWLRHVYRIVFLKNLAGKAKKFGVVSSPGIVRQAGFVASFRKKCLRRQCVFDRHLRKQQTLPVPATKEQPVLPDLHFIRGKREQFGQYGNFDPQTGDFVGAQRWKPQVAESGALGAMSDDFTKGFAALDHADAAAQFPVNVDGDKGAAPESEARRLRLRQLGGGSCERS